MTAGSRNPEGWSALEGWGAERRMNDLEALMWRGERHPEFSSTGVVVELLDSVPDWDRFRAAHAWGVDMVPRLRQRVVEPALPIGPPVWADDPDFDLDHHVRRVRLPAPGGLRELLELAQTIGLTPLDRARPLWTGTLVELGAGRAAYVLACHHCLMDGAAAIQLFSGLHSDHPEPTEDKPRAASEGPGGAPPDALGLALADVAEELRRVPARTAGVLAALGGAVSAPSETLEFLGSVRRLLSPPTGTAPSPLLEHQAGRDWRYGVLECSLADLKAAGRAAGGSVNDAYIAALLGGLQRYHAALGIELGDIPMAMPVSIRRPGDAGGNRFAGAIVAGPAGDPDPAERIAGVRGAVLSVRAEPALDLLGALSPMLARTPSALLSLALAAMPHVDLSASNVPGLTAPAYAAGAAVERMYVFGSLPNASMLATLCSYVGTCCIGINADGAVFTDTDLLWTSLQAGLDEVLDLGRASPPARRPTGRS